MLVGGWRVPQWMEEWLKRFDDFIRKASDEELEATFYRQTFEKRRLRAAQLRLLQREGLARAKEREKEAEARSVWEMM